MAKLGTGLYGSLEERPGCDKNTKDEHGQILDARRRLASVQTRTGLWALRAARQTQPRSGASCWHPRARQFGTSTVPTLESSGGRPKMRPRTGRARAPSNSNSLRRAKVAIPSGEMLRCVGLEVTAGAMVVPSFIKREA